MNIFIWGNTRAQSNNNEIKTIVTEKHTVSGDSMYTFIADEAIYTEESIKDYQAELAKADMVYLTYPIQWGSYPYKMKQSFDTLLKYGFAYSYNEDGSVNKLLSGKKAKVITTSGHPNEYYIDQLKSIHYLVDKTLLGFVGIEVVDTLNIGGRHGGNIEGFPVDEVKVFLNK